MNNIFGKRGTGKTNKLLLYAEEKNIHYFVCSNPHHFLEKASNMGIKGITFLSYTDLAIPTLIKNEIDFVVDNIDLYLKYTQPSLKSFTCSIE